MPLLLPYLEQAAGYLGTDISSYQQLNLKKSQQGARESCLLHCLADIFDAKVILFSQNEYINLFFFFFPTQFFVYAVKTASLPLLQYRLL